MQENFPTIFYLNVQKQVLTHRSGCTAMLSLIYSEILKMLRLWGLVDFDVEIFVPHDVQSLPRGYHKQKAKESDHAHIMTSQTLLVEVTSFIFLSTIFPPPLPLPSLSATYANDVLNAEFLINTTCARVNQGNIIQNTIYLILIGFHWL